MGDGYYCTAQILAGIKDPRVCFGTQCLLFGEGPDGEEHICQLARLIKEQMKMAAKRED